MAALNVTPSIRLGVFAPKSSARTTYLPAPAFEPKLFIVPRRAIAADFIPCEYEVPGFGPCDAQLCGRRAVASSVELQIPVCQSHLAEVEAL
jgi:hypothetical protein